ncbi:MAG: DUF3006 domain-containing protein [Candidatus Schekmanbacteria bacterium]|nr:DUF3006 domain-containing protein [Candidatus Schekmanbacteria bacterium]
MSAAGGEAGAALQQSSDAAAATFHAVVDRFEGGDAGGAHAVLELPDRSVVAIPVALLPPGARPGDWLAVTIRADPEATAAAAARIDDVRARLLARRSAGT